MDMLKNYWTVVIGFCLIGMTLAACKGARKVQEPLDERCTLEPDPGPCRAAMPRYYYDAESGTCKEFIWGGCHGTVPFETLEACQICIRG